MNTNKQAGLELSHIRYEGQQNFRVRKKYGLLKISIPKNWIELNPTPLSSFFFNTAQQWLSIHFQITPKKQNISKFTQ